MPTNENQRSFDKVGALRGTELFGSISDRILRQLAACAVTRQVEPGQIVCSEHEDASALYVVVRGELRSVRQSATGREQVLSTEGPGAVLAAAPVFDGGQFYSTIIADAASELLCIEKRDVHRLCHEHTELLWNLVRALAQRLRHYADLVETLALRNVDQRVAQHLLSVCQKRAARHGNGCVLELRMTRSEMASRVGSTREVVSRALGHLQKCGLIQLDGTRLLTVPDLEALGRFAGSELTLDKARVMSDLSSEIA